MVGPRPWSGRPGPVHVCSTTNHTFDIINQTSSVSISASKFRLRPRYLYLVSIPYLAQFTLSECLNLRRFFDECLWTTQLHDAMQSFTRTRGYWTAGSCRTQEVKALASFADAHFWSNCLKMPKCQAKFIEDARKSDTSSQFRTFHELGDDVVMETYSRPDAKAVFQMWRPLMLDCSTVTLESHKNCSICLPFTHLCIDEVFDEVGSISENVRDQCSPFWLARAILEATAAKFRSEGY